MLKFGSKYLQIGKGGCIVSYPDPAYYMIAIHVIKRSYRIMCEEKCKCVEVGNILIGHWTIVQCTMQRP